MTGRGWRERAGVHAAGRACRGQRRCGRLFGGRAAPRGTPAPGPHTTAREGGQPHPGRDPEGADIREEALVPPCGEPGAAETPSAGQWGPALMLGTSSPERDWDTRPPLPAVPAPARSLPSLGAWPSRPCDRELSKRSERCAHTKDLQSTPAGVFANNPTSLETWHVRPAAM